MKGAKTPAQTEKRLKQHFSPQPHFWVQERGEHDLGVLAQQRVGAENVGVICVR